jgi:selenocysteine lyase/cysteine desulfurase
MTSHEPLKALASRDEFPVLKEIDYLNTASIGLVPLTVQREAAVWEKDIATRGTLALDEAAEIEVFERTRETAAQLLCVNPDHVAIVSSATLALGQIAWWIRPGSGSNVVSVDLEFPSSTFPWFRIAEETGVEVRLVQARDDPAALSLAALERLTDRNTAVICVSQVQFATGHRFDLTRLVELADACEAILVVDATQSAGALPLEPVAERVDFIVAGSYKWLCSPFGAAFCYLGARVRDSFRPPIVGWRSAIDPYRLDARTMDLPPTARRLEFSTSSYGAAVALGRSMNFVLELGVDRILEHNLALGTQLIDGLDELGATVLTPRDPELRSGIITARFPGRDSEAVATELTDHGIVVSPRFGATRFSVHFYNDFSDVERALDALETVLGT